MAVLSSGLNGNLWLAIRSSNALMFKVSYETLADAYSRWSEDGGPLLSAGMAYYIALSLFPVLLILIAGIGFFFAGTEVGQQAEAHLLDAVSEQLSPALGEQVESVFQEVRDKASLGGPVGLITLLIAGLAMFSQFDNAFDRIWNTEPKSDLGLWQSVWLMLRTRLKALAMLLALGALVVVVFVAGVVLSAVQDASNEVLPWGAQVGWLFQFGFTLVLNALAFTLIYRVIPKVKVKWRHALAGGIFAAVAWEIGRQLLANYVIGQRYGSAYGVVGSFLAIMLWAYYAVSVLFFAAEFIQALRARSSGKKSVEQPSIEPQVAS